MHSVWSSHGGLQFKGGEKERDEALRGEERRGRGEEGGRRGRGGRGSCLRLIEPLTVFYCVYMCGKFFIMHIPLPLDKSRDLGSVL